MKVGGFIGLLMLTLGTGLPAEAAGEGELIAQDEPGVHGDSLLTGDFTWARGRFERQGPAGAEWTRIRDASVERSRIQASAFRAALEREGLRNINLEPSCFADIDCFLILEVDRVAAQFDSWRDFDAALSQARLVFTGARAAIDPARQRILGLGGRLETTDQAVEANLVAAAIIDQLCRDIANRLSTSSSPQGATGGDTQRPLTRSSALLLGILLRAQTIAEDARNGRILRAAMDDALWPTIVRHNHVQDAWLLAQHSADPQIQLAFLQRVAPADGAGAAPTEAYRALADRLEGRLHGTQTYGTQVRCINGAVVDVPFGRGIDILGRRRSSPAARSSGLPAPGTSC